MPLQPSDAAVQAHLRDDILTTLRELLAGEKDVALLDVAYQRNAGDTLILQGELSLLRSLGARIRYVADKNSYDPKILRRRMPRGVVLMHGGGNFGDIWHGYQQHRERVARDLPDYRLVVLPQSVWFGDAERAARSNDLLAAHPDLHVLLRDRESIGRAAEMLPDLRTRFCPDAALGWRAPKLPRPTADPRRVLVVGREDREAASSLGSVTSDWLGEAARVDRVDWSPRGRHARPWALARRVVDAHHRALSTGRDDLRGRVQRDQRTYRTALGMIMRANTASAVGHYRGASIAIVDRLHAHIFASLLGIPHVVLDNNHGKIGSVFEAYTHRFSTARYAADLAEAHEIALALLEE